MKLDNSVKKKVIWNTNTIGGMFQVILGWKIKLSLGWCYIYFLGSKVNFIAIPYSKGLSDLSLVDRESEDFYGFESCFFS